MALVSATDRDSVLVVWLDLLDFGFQISAVARFMLAIFEFMTLALQC
jgi:hypothetical protein